jgi:hypothetical protein
MAELAVDTSQFKAGMNEAAASTESANARMKAATEAYNVAAKGTVEVQAALGAAFDKATLAGADYVTAMEAAVAATQNLASVETEETAVMGRAISARMAGSAELRVLEGNMMGSTRAASAFLSTLPGIGAAMQIAFPLFGAAAVVMILDQMVKGIGNVITAYHDLSDAARQTAIDQAIAASNGVETVKAKVGIAEGAARAIKWLNPFSSQTVGGTDQKVETLASVDMQNARQNQLLASQSQLNEAGLKGAALEKQKQTDIQTEIGLREKQINAIKDVVLANESLIKNKDSSQSQVEFGQKQITSAAEQLKSLDTQIDVLTNQAAADAKSGAADTARADRTKPDNRMEDMARSAAAMREADAVIDTMLREQFEADQRAQSEAYDAATQSEHKANELAIRDLEEKRAALRAVTEETIRGAEADYQQATREAQSGMRMGGSSKAGAAKMNKASWSKEETDTSALQSQQDALGYVPGMTGQVKDQYDQIQAQITAATRKGSAEREQITEQEAQRHQAVWNKGFQMFQSIQNEILTSHQSAAQVRMHIEQQVTMAAINALEKELFKHLEVEAKKVAIYVEGKLGKKAADTADAASGHALLVAQNIGEIQSYAAVAAAAAFSATAGIPFVGPILAPIAAAAAYTQAAAFSAVAAFDTGTGFVPREGLGLLHPGEAVLPPPQTEMLGKVLDAVGNGNKGGSSAFNGSITNHFHGSSGAAPKQLMRSVQAGMLRAHALAS